MFWLLGGSRGGRGGGVGILGGGSSPFALSMWDCLQKEGVESYV